ncbi:MAG TPA: CDP-alcohol phosphatidyltransferase family protein [Leptospiraceae bacterium]|nr:CDP-alcohol phosphatidyltransferase family protein [Leptospiraceae bacterium]HMW04436.1 CDP-alcohol phosphatidyltransferase family protein [Leptospiraceae bacterium]HMY30622.1 CDP-alcohol phosphatidyltransferase family protein [Leptospiraceae bacterium]HMZ64436.1 CDP-alcohol phosphatidyltransferase family protein [Leptospiraceae bacterium]HNA06170.1 CDP-alcohol phosphatidyltransferase family protein [Leptospiraceae bacterium]
MSIYQLKSQFQKLLRPVARLLVNLNITANMVTIFACILSIVMGGLLYNFPELKVLWLSLPVFLFLRMALNAIDGIMAKEHNMITPLGTMLNEITDVISDTAIYLSFLSLPQINPYTIIGISILAIISEMTGVVAIQINSNRRYDGPMGKSDRAFFFSILAFVPGFGLTIPYLNLYLSLILMLLIITIINRFKKALEQSKLYQMKK